MGIKAVVRAPKTTRSKMVLGRRKAAMNTPMSATVKRSVKRRYLRSPRQRERKTETAMMAAAERMLVCFLKRKSVPFLMRFWTIY